MTPQEQASYIDDLKRDIGFLEAWKEEMEQKQITFPLDSASQAVIHKDLVLPTGLVNDLIITNPNFDEAIEVNVNGKKYYLDTTKIYG